MTDPASTPVAPIELPSHLIVAGDKESPLHAIVRQLGCQPVWGPRAAAKGLKAPVLAWGRKRTANQATAFAQEHDLPLLYIEDGFLRSFALGQSGDSTTWTFCLDQTGIYYDATEPSDLELMLAEEPTAEGLEQGARVRQLWQKHRISKYNQARPYAGELPERYVLAIDQTRGDSSIGYGRADDESFTQMLAAALEENPDAKVLLKVHPAVADGYKEGHFDLAALRANDRVQVLGENVHATALIAGAERVYTVTSQMGFEALIWGKPVRTFGMPFYAGWGLTEDHLPRPYRRRDTSLDWLVHCALARYCRSFHPVTGKACTIEELIPYVGQQMRARHRYPDEVHLLYTHLWKRPFVQKFLPGCEVHFLRRDEAPPPHVDVAAWSIKPIPNEEQVRSITRIEDGFLRSVGLGAAGYAPVSWVLDQTGMYFDATAPSDLETILATTEFDDELVAQAEALSRRIVEQGLTKYNLKADSWTPPKVDKPIILVAGQVEADASIQRGTVNIKTNRALLQEVRKRHPEAYVIFKPHPDVQAGLRAGRIPQEEARQWCDVVLSQHSAADLLQKVDEVHIMTSLIGFEALLRGKKVATYGCPFYAGWGLTTDYDLHPRAEEARGRQLKLAELVAGALILYPLYLSPTTEELIGPEEAIDELLAIRRDTQSLKPRNLLWRLPTKIRQYYRLSLGAIEKVREKWQG